MPHLLELARQQDSPEAQEVQIPHREAQEA